MWRVRLIDPSGSHISFGAAVQRDLGLSTLPTDPALVQVCHNTKWVDGARPTCPDKLEQQR
jgi:hypothetical protein